MGKELGGSSGAGYGLASVRVGNGAVAVGQWIGWPLWGRVWVGSSGARVWGGSSGGR